MKIQVNKKYLRRDGEVVTIIRDNGFSIFRFIGKTDNCEHVYAESGRFFSTKGAKHKFDLVREL